MDRTDYALLRKLQEGLPLVQEPFQELGRRLGLEEHEVLERLMALRAAGIIRKFRARIDQRQVGLTANALVAWCIPPEIKESTGRILASSPCVTHCYERQPVPGRWNYTLYTVHHGKSRDHVLDEVSSIAARAGISDYLVLFSTKEFKRSAAVRIGEHGGVPA
jgi:siroheme decarboxylase